MTLRKTFGERNVHLSDGPSQAFQLPPSIPSLDGGTPTTVLVRDAMTGAPPAPGIHVRFGDATVVATATDAPADGVFPWVPGQGYVSFFVSADCPRSFPVLRIEVGW